MAVDYDWQLPILPQLAANARRTESAVNGGASAA
jgi:hypothetical protein